MNDSVKFIFKTLIKVPILVFVFYFVFNIFAFTHTYFKVLGLSYVVMQTAVENNYLPPQELGTLQDYMDSITNTGVATNGMILVNSINDPLTDDATIRRQYGEEVAIGVSVEYKFIWPLLPNEQLANPNEKFKGMDEDSAFSGFADQGTLEARRTDPQHAVGNNITFVYKVPGLKYYPDLQ